MGTAVYVGAAVGGRARDVAGRHARLARRARVPVGPCPARLVRLDRAGFPGAGVQLRRLNRSRSASFLRQV